MKNILKTTFCMLLVAVLCISLASCLSKKSTNNIAFGEKYIRKGTAEQSTNHYIFYSDHTGKYERYYVYESDFDSSYNYILSGTVEFVWYEASDGAVYLFETDTQYNDNHTDGKTIDVSSSPLYFSDDFFICTSSSQYGISYNRYIREGSELDNILKDKD